MFDIEPLRQINLGTPTVRITKLEMMSFRSWDDGRMIVRRRVTGADKIKIGDAKFHVSASESQNNLHPKNGCHRNPCQD